MPARLKAPGEPKRMRIGQIYRYSRDKDPTSTKVDGYPNYFHFTHTPNSKRALLEAGINPIAAVLGPDGPRVPAILISSSPHKIGSAQTPWQDFFNPDEGRVRYYGDAKTAGKDPAISRGNAALLAAKRVHDSMSSSERREATPIMLFRRTQVDGKVKGFPMFQGYGVVERAELIAQYDTRTGRSFPNYAYDIAVFELTSEDEEFDWRWISDRRNPALTVSETEDCAPSSWTRWISGGSSAIPSVRRQVTKLMTTATQVQRPLNGSREHAALNEIHAFYEDKRHRFELLAARIVERILEKEGGRFKFGWVTPASSDGGADFVGRLDVGSAFSTVKQVVFGQAKCEAPGTTTSGRDIARTVARLRRGWIGAYVTLGAFSVPTQREVIDDEYPILLVPGGRVAQEILAASKEAGHSKLSSYLGEIDFQYDQLVVSRRPEEILRI